jgi:hypothetical protein
VENWKRFIFSVSELNDEAGAVWDPVSLGPGKWVDMRRLISSYSPNAAEVSQSQSQSQSQNQSGEEPQLAGSTGNAAASSSSNPSAPTATAQAPQSSIFIYSAVFPSAGPLGLSLIAHRLNYATPSGEQESLLCSLVESSANTTAIQPGDILISVNDTALVSQVGRRDATPQAADSFLQAIKGAIGGAALPRKVKFFRLLRVRAGAHDRAVTEVTTQEAVEAAGALGGVL